MPNDLTTPPTTTDADGITVTDCGDFVVTVEPTDVGWLITATDDHDAVLVQYTADDHNHALTLAENIVNADLSDLR